MPTKACYLQCLQDKHIKIVLPHDGTPVTLGRNRDTQIQDLFVSRKQIECHADFDRKKLILKVVGQAYSGCNGYALLKDQTYTLENGDILELIIGAHEFEVIFEGDDSSSEEGEEEKSGAEVAAKRKSKSPTSAIETAPESSTLSKNDSFPPPPLPVAVDIQPPSKKQKIDMAAFASFSGSPGGKWEDSNDRELLIYTSLNSVDRTQIAAFDLDGTLIKTKSGNIFPKTPDDWQLNYAEIPSQLKKLHANGFKIVIVTNQSAINNDSKKIREFKRKIEAVINKIGVPMQVFVAIGHSIYRKPTPGIWTTIEMKNTEKIDKNNSFFVGDAAGREKNWQPKKPKDHSICDRLFAINVGIRFYTPEEYFLKTSSNPYKMPEFDPRKVSCTGFAITNLMGTTTFEVILMVGCQGSGKTHFCKTYLLPQGYSYVSRDKLGSWQKCVSAMEEYLKKKKSVVIDNTNPTKENRQRFIETAKKFNVPVRCFLMDVTFRHAKHNNRFRELTDKSHAKINPIILNSYKKTFEEPQLTEGFDEIVRVPFVPKFEKPDEEKLYRMFLLED